MDSGGILCLHYSFCCSPAVYPRGGDAFDVDPLLSAGEGGRKAETESRLGAIDEYLPSPAYRRDGLHLRVVGLIGITIIEKVVEGVLQSTRCEVVGDDGSRLCVPSRLVGVGWQLWCVVQECSNGNVVVGHCDPPVPRVVLIRIVQHHVACCQGVQSIALHR